jgi:hypothetical protein
MMGPPGASRAEAVPTLASILARNISTATNVAQQAARVGGFEVFFIVL